MVVLFINASFSSDYLGKYLVFFFYPLDFTFVCPTEILAFNDRVKEFKAINAEVIRFLSVANSLSTVL